MFVLHTASQTTSTIYVVNRETVAVPETIYITADDYHGKEIPTAVTVVTGIKLSNDTVTGNGCMQEYGDQRLVNLFRNV